MTTGQLNNLTREKLYQILTAAGANPVAMDTKIEVKEFEFDKPHCFRDWHMKIFANFLKMLAARMTRKMTSFYGSEFNVAIESPSFHFARDVLSKLFESKEDGYYLAFGSDEGNPLGLVSIPDKSVRAWIAKLLGEGDESQAVSGGLSDLEESLLYDIASLLIKVLRDSNPGFNFRPFRKFTVGQFPFEVEGTEELCSITFKTNSAGAENTTAEFLIFCDVLEPVIKTGEKKYSPVKDISREDIAAAATERVNQMHVPLEARLGSAILTMGDVMNLQVNDIVLLNRGVDEPVEIVAEGQTWFLGRPAKSSGKYAVVITERVEDL